MAAAKTKTRPKVKASATAKKKSTPVKRPPAPPPRPAAPPPAAPPPPATSAASAAPAGPPVDHAARVAALWARLEAWIAAAGAPPLALAAPATDKAIKAAEKDLGLAFPPDVRASLRLHDGQTADGPVFPWLPGCGPLLALDDIVATHARVQKLAAKAAPKKSEPPPRPIDRTKPGVYRAGRIPIAGRDPDLTFIDLDPGPAGAAGQVVTMLTKTDLVVIDTSFTAALERWVNVLERGLWVYDPQTQRVHPRALAAATGHPAGWFSRR